MAGPLGRLACMEEMGVWFRSTRIPILTFTELQPPASRQASVRKGTQLLFCRGLLQGVIPARTHGSLSIRSRRPAIALMPYQASHNDGRAVGFVGFEEGIGL